MATLGAPRDGVVGRQAESAVFEGLLADLAEGRGRCVLLEGEPGIGKTALVESVLEGAASLGARVFLGTCDALAHRIPLSVLVDAFGKNTLEAAADSVVDEAGPGSGRGLTLTHGDPVAAAVERILALVDRLCAEGSVVLAVDDLHWGDETSLLVWQRLCRVTTQAPLLLLATCRSAPQRAETGRLRQAVRSRGGTVLVLERLDPTAVRELGGRILGAEPSGALVGVLESAGGNPLYVRELLDSLTRAGAVALGDGVAQLADEGIPASGQIPQVNAALSSLLGVIEDRLALLSTVTREVLGAAALLGVSFAVTDLSAVLARPAGELADAVHEAVAAGVLESAGLRLRFRHGLLRQALCESVPLPVRAMLYRDATRALTERGAPVERVAEVVLAGLDSADGWEAEWIAEHAGALCERAPRAAGELLEHAVARTEPGGEQHAELQDQLAVVACRLSHFEECAAVCREILARVGDPERRGQAAWLLAQSLARTDQSAAAKEVIAAALGEADLPELWRVRLHSAESWLLMFMGRFAEALEAADRSLAEAEKLPEPVAAGFATYVRIVCWSMSASGPEYITALRTALVDMPHLPELVAVRILIGTNLFSKLVDADQFDQAVQVLPEIRALAEQTGSYRVLHHLWASAELAFVQGRWDDARTELDTVSDWVAEVHMPSHVTELHNLAALIAACRGERERAERHLSALPEDMVRVPFYRLNSAYALLAKAMLHEAEDQPDRAMDTLQVILEPKYKDLENKSILLPVLARLALAAGRNDVAAEAAQTAHADHEVQALERTQAVARWCRALVNQDTQALLDVAAYFERVGRRLELGQILEDAAELHARTSGPTEPEPESEAEAASAQLARALDVYAELGAEADARRASRRLNDHGVAARRPPRRDRSGWQSLTQTERRIAERVARGESNPAIAAELYVSRRTVESHVSHILAKLGARSRREVADRMATAFPPPGN